MVDWIPSWLVWAQISICCAQIAHKQVLQSRQQALRAYWPNRHWKSWSNEFFLRSSFSASLLESAISSSSLSYLHPFWKISVFKFQITTFPLPSISLSIYIRLLFCTLVSCHNYLWLQLVSTGCLICIWTILGGPCEVMDWFRTFFL